MVTPEHHVAVVDHLVQHSHPVRRIWSVRIRLAVFLLLGGVAGALVVWTWPRPDLAAKLDQVSFTVGLAMLVLATGHAGLLALRSAVPGRAPSRFESALILILFSTTAFVLCHQGWAPHSTADRTLGAGWPCAARTLAIAVIPWSLLLVAIRRGAPVRVASAAAYAGAAALLLATTILRIACPDDGSLHWLTWHLASVALATALSTPLATTWLQTWRHE